MQKPIFIHGSRLHSNTTMCCLYHHATLKDGEVMAARSYKRSSSYRATELLMYNHHLESRNKVLNIQHETKKEKEISTKGQKLQTALNINLFKTAL